MRKILALIFSFLFPLFFSPSFADETIPEKPVETALQVFNYEGKEIFALTYRNAEHWHTYWKNPGDAGLPTEIIPENFEITELPWPIPTRFIEAGNILAYGYGGEYTRFFTLNENQSDLKLTSKWLVCKHICIPGKVEISGTYNSGLFTPDVPNDFIVSQEELISRFNALPKEQEWPNELDMVLKKGEGENKLVAYYNYTNHGGKDLFLQLGMLTPFPQDLLDITREKLYRNNENTLFGKMVIGWDGEYLEPAIELPPDGLFEEPITMKFLWQDPVSQRVSIIKRTFERFDPIGGDTIESLMQGMDFLAPAPALTPLKEQDGQGIDTAEGPKLTAPTGFSQSFLGILLFAFLGGLILNIMPCVLPIISLKLFGLVIHSDESRSSILKHNIFYTFGVLSTFLAMALVILALKNTGENIGWGFQLQSPVFVSLMVGVLFIFALNLFGLFEFQTPGGKVLGDIELRRGFSGDFMSGVLATVLSTPCSAPFLGTALTFAFTAAPLKIILTFQAIGLGLALPFLMTGIFPSTIRFLPKPGLWMESVKKFLGLTLILTGIWLVDVFISLTDGNLPLLKLNTGLVLLFFAFYFQRNISQKVHWRTLFFVLALLPFISLYTSPLQSKGVVGDSDLINEKNANAEVHWEKWSEKRMEEYRGELVFIDFTAKWCFTCKVNEKLVLETNGFRSLVRDENIKLLLADWTKYDPVIGAFLKKNGLVGVPAYFIQRPDGTLINLGETITLSKIKRNLN